MRPHRLLFSASILASLLAFGVAQAQERGTLLADDYRNLELGMFSSGVIGALTEYHYLPVAAPKGNWVVSMFRTEGSQRAWRVIADDDGTRYMQQTYTAASAEREYMHPMVIAGDELWDDYEVEASFVPERSEDDGMSGILFRYRNDRRYYFAGVIGQRAVLKKVDQGVAFRKLSETVLAEHALAWKAGEPITLKIAVAGDHLRATIGAVTLEARDGTFAGGKVGFTSDLPTRFGAVRVTCLPDAKKRIGDAIAKREAAEDAAVAANPKMVLWRKLDTRGFGVSRNLRF